MRSACNVYVPVASAVGTAPRVGDASATRAETRRRQLLVRFVYVLCSNVVRRTIFTMSALAQKKLTLARAQNLCDYMRSMSPAVLEKLYAHPATCLAVFRDLPDMAKHYIMRLLFVLSAVPQATVSSWATKQAARYFRKVVFTSLLNNDYFSEHENAVEALNSLKIWAQTPMPGGLPGWLIADVFRKSLKVALLGEYVYQHQYFVTL